MKLINPANPFVFSFIIPKKIGIPGYHVRALAFAKIVEGTDLLFL